MAKTPFYYLPMGTLQGRLLAAWLSFIYGCLANLRLLTELYRLGPSKYFTVTDRSGPKRPSRALDAYGSHQFVHLPKAGVKLHYVSAGNPEGQLMLFVHGFPECWFSWRHQLEGFKDSGYHTVAVNMRGYGESDKPEGKQKFSYKTRILFLTISTFVGVSKYAFNILVDDIIELIESLVSKGQPKCVLVAHDWGGVLAWTVTQLRPDLVDRFIVLNAPHPVSWTHRIATSWKQFFASWYMFFFNVPYLAEISIQSGDFKIFDLLFAKYSKDETKKEEEAAVYKHYFSLPNGTTGPLNYYRARLRGYGHVPPVVAGSISPKTLIIWGRGDTALIEQLAEDSSALLCAQVKVHYIDDCSHWIQLERPEEVNQLMLDFLSQKD